MHKNVVEVSKYCTSAYEMVIISCVPRHLNFYYLRV